MYNETGSVVHYTVLSVLTMNVIKTFVHDKRKSVVKWTQTEYNMTAVNNYLYQNNIHNN